MFKINQKIRGIMMYQSIRPGQEWLDTNGKRIEAHGGNIFFEN
jgi:hypothetical protein